MRIRTLVVAFAIAGAVAPTSAFAHAQLESTSPGRADTVPTEPRSVSFTFGEPVTGTAGAIRVFDGRGRRVDDGAAFHPGGRDTTFAVGLKPGLADGTYTATYRVVSADTHIVTGGFVFSIGTRSAGPGETVGQLLAGQRTGAVTSWAFVATRALQYGAIGIGAGGLLFLLAVWLPALAAVALGEEANLAARGRLRLLLLGASAVGFVTALVGVGLEGAEAAGVTFWDALTSTILGEVLDTRFGTVWAVAAGAWLLVGAGAAVLLAPRRPARPWILALPLVALLTLPALAGHAGVQSPVGLFLPASLVHVAAMAAWFGGLVALLVAVPAATGRVAPTDRTRLLAAVLLRFSPIALVSVAALLVTGIVQSLIEIDAWSQLLDTPFGRAVLIKFLLLLVLIGLGAVNRQRTVPRLRALAREDQTPGESGVLLRRTLRLEVAIVVVVLVVAGALAGYPPAKTVASGPVSVNTRIGPQELSVDVDPARVGANTIHIYLLDPKTGAQFTGAKELTVTATLPSKGIGPLPLDVQPTGPGHYTIPSAVLGAPGAWKLDLTARVSAFDEYEKTIDVPIR